jgi:hypothetical protein
MLIIGEHVVAMFFENLIFLSKLSFVLSRSFRVGQNWAGFCHPWVRRMLVFVVSCKTTAVKTSVVGGAEMSLKNTNSRSIVPYGLADGLVFQERSEGRGPKRGEF